MIGFLPEIKQETSRRNRRRTPVDIEKSPLWQLDDTQPAGPYKRNIDDYGLRLICLATIRQAVMDERSAKSEDVVLRARQFLASTAKDWLKAMRIFRRNDDPDHIYDLIYGHDYEQLFLLTEEKDGESEWDNEIKERYKPG